MGGRVVRTVDLGHSALSVGPPKACSIDLRPRDNRSVVAWYGEVRLASHSG